MIYLCTPLGPYLSTTPTQYIYPHTYRRYISRHTSHPPHVDIYSSPAYTNNLLLSIIYYESCRRPAPTGESSPDITPLPLPSAPTGQSPCQLANPRANWPITRYTVAIPPSHKPTTPPPPSALAVPPPSRQLASPPLPPRRASPGPSLGPESRSGPAPPGRRPPAPSAQRMPTRGSPRRGNITEEGHPAKGPHHRCSLPPGHLVEGHRVRS